MIFAGKINEIPEFYIARKMPEFYMIIAPILHDNCPKTIFSRILGGTCPLPPSHVPMNTSDQVMSYQNVRRELI